MSAIIDHLKCPICFEIPEGKVYQCKNGHTFCSQCSTRLKACPQCRVALGFEKIRNRTLEQILDVTKFACPNKDLGCMKILWRTEISVHLLYCKFEPFYFCKIIGFENCSYNALSCLRDNAHCHALLIAHLRDAHPEIQQTEVISSSAQVPSANYPWAHLTYKDFLSRANKMEKGGVAIWTPHLIKITKPKREMGDDQYQDDEGMATLLLILCQVSALTRNAAWICLCMTTDTDLTINTMCTTQPNDQRQAQIDVSTNTKTRCSSSENDRNSTLVIQYQIKGQRRTECCDDKNDSQMLTPTMTWSAPVLTFKDIDKELESYALRVPLCVLNSFNNGGDELRISLKVDQIGSSRENKGLGNLRSLTGKESTEIHELTSFTTNSTFRHPRPSQCPLYCCEHQQDDDAEEEDDPNNQVIFDDVYCNGCGQRPLVSVRYKCLQCIDYDLCKLCMERGDTHMHHIFARINNPNQSKLLNWKHRSRILKGRSSYI